MTNQKDIEILKEKIKRLEAENTELKKSKSVSSDYSPYKALAEKSTDGILIIHDQIIKYVNEGFIKMTGFTRDEIIGASYSKFTPEKEFKKLRNNSLRRLKGEDIPSIYTTFIQGKDGKLTKTEINVTVDSYLNRPAFIVAIRDLTQFEKMKDENEEQAQFLSTLLNALPVPVFYKNKEKKYTGCNLAFSEFAGLPQDKLIGKSAFDIFPEKAAMRYEELDDELLKSHEEKVTEIKLHSANKSSKEIILYKQVFLDKSNNAAGIIGVFLDLTEMNKFRIELERKQRFLESIIQNIPVMIFTIDPDDIVTLMEGKILKTIGLVSKEAVGKSYKEVFQGEAGILKNFEKAIKGEIESSFDFFRGHYFETHFALMKGKKRGLLGVSLDITERRKAEIEIQKYLLELQESKDKLEEYSGELEESQKDLIELNESKDRFFSIISHDLRSPFTSLVGLSDFIVQDFDSIEKEDLREAIFSFNRNTKNILSFLENLLSWARIQMNKQEIHISSVNLLEIILNVIEIFKLNIKNKKLTVEKNIDENIHLFVDENMINTAVRNIVSNSIKFTSDGGELKFSAAVAGDTCEVKISDTGMGMEEEKLAELFKLDSIKSSPGLKGEKGTGLGLLLTKDLVEANGGSISVNSELNKGTTFILNLPVVSQKH